MKYRIVMVLIFVTQLSHAQNDVLYPPLKAVVSPLKIGFGTRLGEYDTWNKQLETYGYSTIDDKLEYTYQISYFHKSHVVFMSKISWASYKDSMFMDDHKIKSHLIRGGLSIGYNICPIEKVHDLIIVSSIGFYFGQHKLICSKRLAAKIAGTYSIDRYVLKNNESGLQPGFYLSLDPFKRNPSMLSLMELGFEIGAYYNTHLLKEYQYSNSLDGSQFPNDPSFIPYFNVSIEFARGIFGIYEKSHDKSIQNWN